MQKSLGKCSFHETRLINCFYIHRFNLLFSEDEICFKLPSLFRLGVALHYSLNFSIRLLHRHQYRSGVKCEVSSYICLGVIFAKEMSSQFILEKTCFNELQHYKGILQLLRRKFCGMWGGKRQERRMIQLEKKENGEGETNLGTVLIKELVLSKDKGTKLKGKDRGICSHNVGFSSGGSVWFKVSKFRSIRGPERQCEKAKQMRWGGGEAGEDTLVDLNLAAATQADSYVEIYVGQ